MKREIITLLISILLAALFSYTSVYKMLDYNLLKEQIAAFNLLEPVSNWIAWLLPISELTAAILLIIPRYRLKGLIAAEILMLLFTIYIGYIISLNEETPCSCGGIIERLTWKEHISFNIFFMSIAAVGIVLQRQLERKNKYEFN